jgi:hypothetical protein
MAPAPELPYRIKRGERGFNVWKFRDWSLDLPGWRILAADLTPEAAEQDVLRRMGLEPKPETEDTEPMGYAWVFTWP